VRSIGIAESLLQNHLADLERQELVSRIKSGDQFLFAAKSEVNRTREMILGDLEEFHQDNPHLSGIGRAELSSRFMKTTEAGTLDTILEDLSREGKLKLKGDLIALASFNAGLTSEQQNIYDRILSMLRAEPYSPPTLKELYSTLNLEKAKVDLLINYGKSQNEWIVLQNGLIYPRTTLKEIQEMVRNWIEKKGSITAADLRDLIRASRKFAISILEYFDQIGFTVREGDERFLNS
jgi:selenocysteine-specific elongation factor